MEATAPDCIAAVFEGVPQQIVLRRFPLPAPAAEEVLVRILGCTICGSDLHSFSGRRTVPVPTVLGHEFVGEIVRFGETTLRIDFAGEKLSEGSRISWGIVASCGKCFFCQQSLPQKCLRGSKYGHEPFHRMRQLSGGFAEYCLLVPGTTIVRVPDELPLEVACPASCATATVAAACAAASDLRGRTICICGAGILGLTASAMSREMGAAKIVVVDPIELRRNLALEFGATTVAAPEEFAHVANEQFGSLGVDLFFECSGSANAFQSVWPLVRTGGTIVLIGSVFPGPTVPIALEQIVRRHLTIKGVHNYAAHDLVAAVAFLSMTHRRYPFGRLVSEWFSLNSIADAFRIAAQPASIRVGVRPM